LRAAWFAVVVALCFAAAAPAQQTEAKRPLMPTDFDGWKSIQAPVLSRDGKVLAYDLMPAEGDGEVVVRNIASGAEHRVPTGRAALAAAGPAGDPAAPAPARGVRPPQAGAIRPAGGGHQFTPDVRAVLFVVNPTKAELDKARQEKKKLEDMPRPALAVFDLASAKVTGRIERVSTFTVGGEGAGVLLYKRGGTAEDRPANAGGETPLATGGPGAARTPPKIYGTDLVIRNLADGSERVLADVTEYSLTRDGKTLVYTVASRQEETNGVYTLASPFDEAPTVILDGKGRYQQLTWDARQSQLVFASDKEDMTATQPKFKVYHWERSSPSHPTPAAESLAMPLPVPATVVTAAVEAAPPPDVESEADETDPPELRPGWAISMRTGFSFSTDGTRLYLNTGPVPDPGKAPPASQSPSAQPPRGGGRRPAPASGDNPAAANDDRVVVDLWHYKDEYIQPMQKVRAAADQNRAYRAVYFIRDKTFRQLSDESVDVTPAPEGDWAIGADNRKYRRLTGYGPELSDYALVNIRTGEKKPLLEASHWSATFSPHGKWLLSFDGKDWQVVSVAGGEKKNLTAKLPVKFISEDYDMPSEPPAYGVSGWSDDEKYVLLNDHYDVWKVAADGSEATLLTGGTGRKSHTVLRPVRLTSPNPEQRERGFDLSQPLLFKAVNELTRDEGFYRLEPGSDAPKKLIMDAHAYGLPIKAKDADTLLLTVSTFYDFPDYCVTDPDFREFRKVTDANPQKKALIWGKAELVHYKNLDGVELSGMLIKPENFDPQKKYPMMVYIYERLSQNLHHFVNPAVGTSINPSFYASNGYLVFMPDIVYKVGTPGQSALQCVLPGIQAVVDKGSVDEKAIGIQGHSWGGYQIAYMVTQTNRFKAAAAGAPVSNMVSAYDGIRWGTGLPRQFQYERTQSRIGGTLWEKPTRFIENSPIFMADRVQTPLLMLHNDQDDAVPWYQGIEYFLALRRLEKECYLFNYNGELHGLRKKANQRDYTMRMQQFFDHHLKGTPKPEWMEKGIPYLERDDEKNRQKATPAAAEKK
jgi:dipeptidyl aminopeptidase/acylaminoacyl peptidase